MPRYSKSELEEALGSSKSYAEALRRLRLSESGGNHKTIQKWTRTWKIDVSHFETQSQRARRNIAFASKPTPIEDLLVKGTKRRSHLKRRLYAEGLKEKQCEFCGQGPTWRGKHMGLVLDHINGDPRDNRLENLRILCPNCNATLPTHCGRKNRTPRPDRRKGPRPNRRKVKDRPPLGELLRQVSEVGYSATGRLYSVSDNAIRKWIKAYQRG